MEYILADLIASYVREGVSLNLATATAWHELGLRYGALWVITLRATGRVSYGMRALPRDLPSVPFPMVGAGILYQIMNQVTDRRTINALERAGHLTPVPTHCRPKRGAYYYVDRDCSLFSSFTHKGKSYKVEYVSGCFFPMLYRIA